MKLWTTVRYRSHFTSIGLRPSVAIGLSDAMYIALVENMAINDETIVLTNCMTLHNQTYGRAAYLAEVSRDEPRIILFFVS